MTAEPMVHVVDDDSAVRDSLRELVESAGLRAALYASAEQYLEACQVSVGCLVLDIRMAELSGLDLLPILRDRACDLPTIILTGHGDVPAATRAFKQGAVDFIQKPFDPPELLRSIRAAMEQDRQARQRHAIQSDVAARTARLSAREREVMDLIVLGLANKQIAARLGIAERTVEDHRSRVMRTMEVDSVAQLVRLTAVSGS
jgi:two-component system, LuxR family, response regulator FixJ